MEEAVRCPDCVGDGERSYVYPGASSSTLMYCPSYYDEAGVYHSHDTNIVSTEFSCSRGHSWTVDGHKPCPNCAWGGE